MCLKCSTSTQKQVSGNNILFLAASITYLVLMFQIFTGILLLQIKTLSLNIFAKKKIKLY